MTLIVCAASPEMNSNWFWIIYQPALDIMVNDIESQRETEENQQGHTHTISLLTQVIKQGDHSI